MKMLGQRNITVTSRAAGSYVAGDWVDGAETSRTIKAVLQPLSARELQQLPEAWRTRARWKLYSAARLKTVDVYAETQADFVSWSDPSVGSLQLLVLSMADYSNTPAGMTLRHFKYVLIEQQVSNAAR